MLKVSDLTVKYQNLTIVNRVSFGVLEGEWLMLVGPNGAGKSTIVSAISQSAPYDGSLLFEGNALSNVPARVRAKNIGILTQSHFVNYPYTVEEVVRLGRYAYRRGLFTREDPETEKAVEEALLLTGLLTLRGQSVLTLSGGELQRTFLAQLFAQNPKLLILDEPANHLDLVYQKELFTLLSRWIKTPGRAILSVVHDLSLARAFGTHALLLHHGHVENYGPTSAVLTRDALSRVYSMDVYEWMQTMLGQWAEASGGTT